MRDQGGPPLQSGQACRLTAHSFRGRSIGSPTLATICLSGRRGRSPDAAAGRPTPANAVVVSESQTAARRMTALDWAAKLVEENGRELAESFLSAARNGDWRAADALMNRIYGKPEQALVAHMAPTPALELVRSLSLEEKPELLRRLQDGSSVSTASALPVVGPAPPAP